MDWIELLNVGRVALLCVGCIIVGFVIGLFVACACQLSGRISEQERREAYWHEIRLDELE
jgi:hypothetical protein